MLLFHPRVESDDGGVEVGNFGLADRKIPIKHVQKLSLDPSDITFPEDSGRDCPMNVLKSRIIRELWGIKEIRIRIPSRRMKRGRVAYLGSEHESTEEDAVESPFFSFDREMRS